jgi:hypothetical protein
MAEMVTRRRPTVNAATIARCPHLAFLGSFLNSRDAKRAELLEHLGMTTQGFSRWFSVDDIRWSLVVKIYNYLGYDVRMRFTYPEGSGPSESLASSVRFSETPAKKLGDMYAEMKLNNVKYEEMGRRIQRTPQCVGHWFVEDDTMISNIYSMAEALGASVGFVPVER